MKVLFLVSRYAPHDIGGAERVAATLAQTLTAQGHEVLVLTTAFDDGPAQRVIEGIRVRSIPLRNIYDFAVPGPAIMKPLWHLIDSYNPLMGAAVGRVLREESPDIVHSHLVTGFSVSAWAAAGDRGIPVVHTLHDHYVICARSSMATGDGIACHAQHTVCALLSRPRIHGARHVDAVVGVSRYILDRHRALGAFESIPARVIPNPCHLSGVGLARATREVGSGGPVRIGFLGRLELNKGITRLLAASRSLPVSGWSLSVAGSGDPEFTRQLRVEYESASVSFVGRVDPAAFLSQLDVLVVPSTVPETFGMAAAEALAVGVPVVASRVAALPELVREGENGFLFDTGEEGSLSRLLGRIVRNPSMIAGMAEACRSSVLHLAPANVARQYAEVYAEVAAGREPSRSPL